MGVHRDTRRERRDEQPRGPARRIAACPGVIVAPLQALFSTVAELRRDTRALVSELRRQVGEMRSERARLSDRRLLGGMVRPGHQGAGADELHVRVGLTDRERGVARQLAEGRSNSAIAQALRITPHTARHHTQRVLAKLGVHSRGEAGARLRG